MSEDNLTVEAARAYRSNLPKRRGRETAPPASGLSTLLLRSHIADVLGDVPRDALAATVALDLGDDDLAYDRLAAVVSCVREAARSMNELRAATAKVEGS